MTRFVRYVILAFVALVLIVLAVANSQVVQVRLLPVSVAEFLGFGWTLSIPLFLVVFGGILLGLLMGFVWEWFRAHQTRATASAVKKKAKSLEREVDRLKKNDEPQDEVLALLEKPTR